MIEFQKWDYSPTLTDKQQWSATFIKTIMGDGCEAKIITAYSSDQLKAYLTSNLLDDTLRNAMSQAVIQFQGEPRPIGAALSTERPALKLAA